MRTPYPAMAALLAAASAALMLPGFAFADPPPAPPPSAPATLSDEQVGAMTKTLAPLLQNNTAARKDAADSISKLVLDPEKKYAEDEVRGKPENVTRVGAMTEEWIKGASDKAAPLYYVLRSAAPPDWVKADAEAGKTFVKSDRDLAGCLHRNLLGNEQQKHSMAGAVTASSLAGVGSSLWQFLDYASGSSIEVLHTCGLKLQTAASVAGHDQGPAAVPMGPGAGGTGGQAAALISGSPSCSFDDLYRTGAVVAQVYKDNGDGFRSLSIKMYTVKKGDGLVNMIGVMDITNPNRVFAPAFVPLDVKNKSVISVSGSGPDGQTVTRNYELNVDKDGNVVLSRPGTKEGKGGVAKFTPEQLAGLRADQVAQKGTTVIEGKSYYVLGQGGAQGSYLFFDKDLIDGRGKPGANPRLLRPTAVAGGVEVVDVDGVSLAGQGKPDMGKINGNPYHLEYDSALKQWVVKAGPGDVPPPPPPKDDGTAGSDDGKNPPDGGSGGGGTGTGSQPDPTAKDLDGIVQRIVKNGGGTEYNDEFTGQNANAQFDADSKKKVHLLKSDKIRFADAKDLNRKGFRLILAPKLTSASEVPYAIKDDYGPARPAGLTGLRGFNNYIVMETDDNILYRSVQNLLGELNKKERPVNAATLDRVKGCITGFGKDDKGKDVQDFVSLDIARDVIRYYAKPEKDGKPAADAASTIDQRIQKHLQGKSGLISGCVNGNVPLTLWVGKDGWDVWPEDKPASKTGLDGGGSPDARGGAVFDVPVTPSENAGFPASIPLGDATLTRFEVDDANATSAAVYKGSDSKWYIMYRVKTDNNPDARQPPTALTGPGLAWLSKKGSYKMQGLQNAKAVSFSSAHFAFWGDASKGMYVVYKNVVPNKDGSNVKEKKDNCVGPVLWHGMSQAEAQDACESGKL